MRTRTRCQRSPRASVASAYSAIAKAIVPSASSLRVGMCWRLAHQTTAARATTEMSACMSSVRRWTPDIRKTATPFGSDRHAPEGKPALQLGLQRQFSADLRLDLELALDVARLLSRGGHEGVPGTPLVVVDEVDGLLGGVLEGEDGGEQAIAVAAG